MRRMLQNAIKQPSLSRVVHLQFQSESLFDCCIFYEAACILFKASAYQWSPWKRLPMCMCTHTACMLNTPFLIKTLLRRQCKVDNLHTCTSVGIRRVDNESEVQHSICPLHTCITWNSRLYAILHTPPLLVWRISLFFAGRPRLSAILLIWALCWRSDTWNGYWETVDAAAAETGPSSDLLFIHQPQYLISGARAPSFSARWQYARGICIWESERESGYYSLPPHMCLDEYYDDGRGCYMDIFMSNWCCFNLIRTCSQWLHLHDKDLAGRLLLSVAQEFDADV